MGSRRLKRGLSWVKLVVGLSLLALIVTSVDASQMLTVLSRSDWTVVAAAFGLFILIGGLEGVRLWLVFGGDLTPLAHSIRTFFESLVFLNLLPGTLGGDGYMVMRFRHFGLTPAVTKIMLIRMLGAGVMVVLGVIALPFWVGTQELQTLISDRTADHSQVGTWLVVAIFVALLTTLALPSARGKVRMVTCRIVGVISTITWRQHGWLLSTTMLMQFIRAAMFASLVLAVGGEPTLVLGLILAAAGLISMLLPLTFSGLGIREGAIAGALIVSGVLPEQALAVALLARGMLIAGAAIGGLLLLLPNQVRANSMNSSTFP